MARKVNPAGDDLDAMARRKASLSPQELEALSPEETRLMLHELRVHQIELEMQNEELRQTQVELHTARARYFNLYDLAPVGYCTLSKQGLIQNANLTVATLLGLPRGALVKQPLTRFILKEDQDIFYLHRKLILESGEPQSCELRMVKDDRTQFWAQLTATAAQDGDSASALRIVLSDVTGRKLLQIQSEHERSVLEFLAGGKPLPEMLTHLLLSYEALFTGMQGSVLLLDEAGRKLRHGTAPSLPSTYFQSLDGMEIGPTGNSCGISAHTRQPTIVEDIASDPRWKEFRERALAHGLHACWSAPIFGAASQVLGTFAFYFNAPRTALPSDLAAIERGAHLASLAIARHQALKA